MMLLEIRKLLKTPVTLILIGAALLLSFVMAWLPVSFEYARYLDDGEIVVLQGREALRYHRENFAASAGELTPELAKEALAAYHDCLRRYNAQTEYDLPDGVYSTELGKYRPVFHAISEIYADPVTGIVPELESISPEDLDGLYQKRTERLESLMEQEDWPAAARKKARAMYADVSAPMRYYPYYHTNAMDYETFLFFLVMLCCVVIAAPVFSIDRQTGADDIQRCAKHGRARLALGKCGAVFLISGLLFILCTLIYLAVSTAFYGTDGLRSDLQMLISVFTLQNWSAGTLLRKAALAGFFSCLASVGLTLVLSSRVHSTGAAIGGAILLGVSPTVISTLVGSRWTDWLCAMLPSGGVCLQNSFYYALYDISFLHVLDLSVPAANAMVFFAVLEIPLFLLLTLWNWQKGRRT